MGTQGRVTIQISRRVLSFPVKIYLEPRIEDFSLAVVRFFFCFYEEYIPSIYSKSSVVGNGAALEIHWSFCCEKDGDYCDGDDILHWVWSHGAVILLVVFTLFVPFVDGYIKIGNLENCENHFDLFLFSRSLIDIDERPLLRFVLFGTFSIANAFRV